MQLVLPQVLAAVEMLPGKSGQFTFRVRVRVNFCTCGAVQVQSLSLRKNLLGAWPLVDHFLRRLELAQLLTQHLGSHRAAAALQVLVLKQA